MSSRKPILVLEDDDIDIQSIRRAFKRLEVKNEILIFTNGEDGLSYLLDASKPNPCLIISDINMPRMNGFEFMRKIKADKLLKMIPAILLTTSNEAEHRRESYLLGAAGYIVKPVEYEAFEAAIRTIQSYWGLCDLL